MATASRVRRWVLVERPGPWGHDALTESRLDPEVGRRLGLAGRDHGARVLLIRRPGWDRDDGPRRLVLVNSDRRHRWIAHLEFDDERDLLDVDLSVLAAHEPPRADRLRGVRSAGAHLVDDPLVLVCTHGRHDACCANLGRPVVRALADSGLEVWESSHVGGDRFAANLVALPSGVYLGRVEPEHAVSVVRGLLEDRIDLDTYRGRSCFPTIVQAAEIVARRELDATRVDELVLERVDVDGDVVRGAFSAHGDGILVTVRRHPTEPVRLSCGAGDGIPWRYEVVSLRRA